MSRKKDSTPVASTAVELAFAMAPTPTTKAVAGLAVVAPKVVGALEKHWHERRGRRRLDYIRIYLEGDAVDEGVAEAQVQALADDPKLRELVFDAFRVIDDAMTEGAVFVMAKLTRLYRARGLTADSFSRGVRRVMQDITPEDFVALREVLMRVTAVQSAREVVGVSFSPGNAVLTVAAYPPVASATQAERYPCNVQAPPECLGRALDLLKAGLLAQEGASRASEGIGGADHMFVELPKMRTLLDLMP